MKVLIGCEESGVVRSAFEERGHEVVSCDLKPTRRHGPHYRGDVFDLIDFPFDFAGFHVPCTDSSVSGAKHFEQKKFDGRYYAGNAFWFKTWRRSRHIPAGYMEHPVSVISTLFRKPDQIIQPWMFGHFETKQTCLWLWGGLPLLVPAFRTPDECREFRGLPPGTKPTQRVHRMAPGENRARDRAETLPGIANAMAAQWGATAQALVAELR